MIFVDVLDFLCPKFWGLKFLPFFFQRGPKLWGLEISPQKKTLFFVGVEIPNFRPEKIVEERGHQPCCSIARSWMRLANHQITDQHGHWQGYMCVYIYIFYIAIRRMCVHVNIYIYKYSKSNAETHTYIIYHVFHQFSYHHCLLSSHLQYHRFPYIFPTFSQAVFFSRDLLAAQLNKGISDMPG